MFLNSTSVLNILHLEDNPADAELVRSTLIDAGIMCKITVVGNRREFEDALAAKDIDLILSDYSLPLFNGAEAFQIARSIAPDAPFIFVSGTLGEEAAIQCIVNGARDYVLKNKLGRLVPAVKRAIKESESAKQLELAEFQRQRAMEDLRQSEARFRGVLECAPDSAIIVDSEGKIVFANPRTEEIFGFTGEELAGKPVSILVPDRFKTIHLEHMERFSTEPHARGMGSAVEIFGRRKDGSEFPADVMLSPIRMDHGTSVLAMIRDVTSSRQAERALRESEEQFRSIYQASPVAIVNIDAAGRILKCNPAVGHLLGFSPEELFGRGFNDLAHPDDLEIGNGMMADLIEGQKEIVQFQKRYVRRTGEIILAHLTVSAVRNENGSIRYAVAIVEDVTEKWKAGESLRRSEERYRNLVDNARDAIYTLSSSATILSLNPAFEALTGWEAKDWIGRRFTGLIHPEDIERAQDSFRATLRGELTDVIRYRIMRKSGEYAVGEFSAKRFSLEDGEVGVLGIARDVTSQIALEEQLRQSLKMESVGTLAGGVAHDFNNILGIIIGYSELTLKSLKNDDRLRNNLRSIEKAAKRGVDLVRQLLMFARKQERVVHNLDVNGVVADVYRMVEETFPKVIAIDFLPSADPLRAECDQTEIHQAVLNLCVNARDAMMERADGKLAGGTLKITTSQVRGELVRSNHPSASADVYIRIEVSDTGPGIDEMTRERIFEPFFTTKERGKGTGLGLATVYGIVSSYNGFVELESQVGKGTTFIILLPMIRKHADSAGSAHEKAEAPGGSESLLVVEDEVGLRDLLLDILGGMGYRVLGAEDGERALSIFLDNKDIDLVISDLGLPKVGGLDLFQAMRKLKPGLKVILVSGYVDEHDREKMTKEGVNEFIQKPYKSGDVLRKVRSVLDGE